MLDPVPPGLDRLSSDARDLPRMVREALTSDRSFLADLARAVLAHRGPATTNQSLGVWTGGADRGMVVPSHVHSSPASVARPLTRGILSPIPTDFVARPEPSSTGVVAPPAVGFSVSRDLSPVPSSAIVAGAAGTTSVDRPRSQDILGIPVPSIGFPSVPAIDPSTLVTSALGIVSASATAGPMPLADYPRPAGDTGRGFHWIPTLHSDPAVVDHFVAEAKKLGASWVVILNDGAQIGDNDYLVKRLVENQIEPVMRLYTAHGAPIDGDLTKMVQHYSGLGVHYFLPYNEPNLPEENPDGKVSVKSYVDRWLPAARAILAGGGLPGLGGLAPGAPVDDVAFLRSTLDEIKRRGAVDVLDRAWVSVHNYTFNRPIDYQDDSNGFLKFRWYDQVVRDALGRDLPIISTEGGPRMGDNVDQHFPPVDEARRDKLAADAFAYLNHREPYFFAQTLWVLANEAGGGNDPSWNADAIFGPGGVPTPLAMTLEAQEGPA
jgi:hypothetical protein